MKSGLAVLVVAVFLFSCKSSTVLYTVMKRTGPDHADLYAGWVDVVLAHDGKELHVRCNNYKGTEDSSKPVGCNLWSGKTVKCKSFPDRMSDKASGYDLICGDDRENGKLIPSYKNELLQLDKREGYLVTRSEPFIHHYDGSPCGLQGKETCDMPEMRYTLVHKGVTIVAHCQSWNERDTCGQLQVGETYPCEIDAATAFGSQMLSCNSNSVLGIDSSVLTRGNGNGHE